ncbi:MAG: DUF3504 domain-containing protein, partial [Sedimenticola sp.]
MKPKLWANTNNPDRCPIKIYKLYAERRPVGYSDPDLPFYIATTTVHLPSPRDTWFKRNPVGINKLGSMMKRMVAHAGLNANKRLSNHSARKYLVQKLNDNNVPANQIMQITGHRNIGSINNYSHINHTQHKQISNILYSGASENNRTNNNPHMASLSSDSLQNRLPVHSNTISHNSNTAESCTNSSFHVSSGSFNSIFGAQIHGGTFN